MKFGIEILPIKELKTLWKNSSNIVLLIRMDLNLFTISLLHGIMLGTTMLEQARYVVYMYMYIYENIAIILCITRLLWGVVEQ